jgi:acyl transferase domain-containing protein/acyl carrier protein
VSELSPVKRALLAVQEMQERLDRSERARREPIAIVGLSCRFPGADDPEELWSLLREGRETVSEVPADRWDAAAWFDPRPGVPGKSYTRRGGFLRRVDGFDAQFFGIAPREAVSMDPQQRLLLETSWEALERAGQAPDRLAGSATGVFVGFSTSDYAQMGLWSGDPARIDTYSASGGTASVAAGRLSYVFGFQGPSLAVDTACSSSLVALHLACQSLRSGECRLALAGGVYLLLSPLSSVALSALRMMAPDGRCKAFDARADGFVQGEGCGVVVLKRLSDALADGDPILAVVRGSAVNQDGRSGGLTAPNGPAQEAVLRAALAAAGVEPAAVGFVEAHGTGTALGDPIEMGALATVLGPGREAGAPLRVGSIKTNLGHLAAAAGIAGLIKAVLALRYEAIPPHLHLEEPSPYIPWSQLPVEVPTRLTPWPAGEGRRFAGVSSFGFSGTNAHVVLEEAPVPSPAPGEAAQRTAELLPLSARGPEELRALAAAWTARLGDSSVPAWPDLAFTAAVGRAGLSQRLAVVASSAAEARDLLAAAGDGAAPADEPKIAFLFSGQGARVAGAGRGLLEAEPVVLRVVERCEEILREIDPAAGPAPLRSLLLADGASPVDVTWSQEALFALQAGLAALWRSWGIEPAAVLGHSLGEIAAAVAAGVLDLDDAFRFAAARARALRRLPAGGGMATVLASEAEVADAVARHRDRLAIAAVNAARQTVLSGDADALAEALEELAARGVGSRPLETSHAFHSPLVEPVLDEIERAARGLAVREPRLRLLSGCTGRPAGAAELADPAWWRRQARQAVRFADGLERLRELGCTAFVEIGPGTQLSALGRQGDDGLWLPSLRSGRDSAATLLAALGQLWTHGAAVDWEGLHRGRGRRRIGDLPTSPFRRQRYWMEGASSPLLPGGSRPLLGRRLPLALTETVFAAELSPGSPPLLDEHRIYGLPVVSGSAWLSMALAAARELLGSEPVELRDVTFREPCVLDERLPRPVQLVWTPAAGGGGFRVAGQIGDEWRDHATGWVVAPPLPGGREHGWERGTGGEGPAPAALLPGEGFYALLEEAGITLGPGFRWIERLWHQPGEAAGWLRASREADGAEAFSIHPGLLDSCFLIVGAASLGPGERPGSAYLPLGIESLTLFRRPAGALLCHARLRQGSAAGGILSGDLWAEDGEGRPVLEVAGLCFKQVGREALERGDGRAAAWLHLVDWWPCPLPENAGAPLDGSWMVVTEQEARVGTILTDLLRARGADCIMIRPGETLPDAQLSGVVFVAEENEPIRSCGALLHLIQTLLHGSALPRLWIITRGAQAAGPGPVAPAGAPLWGLGDVAALEHPGLGCVRIDLDPEAGPEEAAAILLAELAADPNGVEREDRIAWRGGARHVARLVRSVAPRDGSPAIRPDRTYLVTGGLGALGLEVAAWLVRQGARELTLLGRSGPSETARPRLDEMATAGARVRVLQADVSDRSDLAAALAGLADGPPLAGVVHAAGILDDGILAHQTPERLARVLAPKVEGAWNLHALTAGQPLDFFVLFSSAAALTGAAGQGGYAAANAFLDALAWHRRALGLPALSVNWGPWGSAGMAAALDDRGAQRLAVRGVGAIKPAQGLDLLGRLLADPAAPPQVAVLPIDWPRFLEASFPGGNAPAFLEAVAPPPSPSADGGAAPLKDLLDAAGPEEQGALVLDWVRERAARILGLGSGAALDPATPLGPLGLDSLMAVELKNRIEGELGVGISTVALLRGPSPAELSGQLLEALAVRSLVAGAAAPADAEWEVLRL